MKTAKTVEPSVGSGETGDAQCPGDRSGFTLKHRSGDTNAQLSLAVVPFPDEPVRLFVARPSGPAFTGTDVRIQFGLLLVPFAQIGFLLAQYVEYLRFAASELQRQLAHTLARFSRQNHLNSFGKTQLLTFVPRRDGRRAERRCGTGCGRSGRSGRRR